MANNELENCTYIQIKMKMTCCNIFPYNYGNGAPTVTPPPDKNCEQGPEGWGGGGGGAKRIPPKKAPPPPPQKKICSKGVKLVCMF